MTDTVHYPIADLDRETVTDDLIDQMIADAGSEREAVRQLLEGQLDMCRRQAKFTRFAVSAGFDRGRSRPNAPSMPPAIRPAPLDY